MSDIYLSEIAAVASRVEAAVEAEEIVVTNSNPNDMYLMAQVSEEEFEEHSEATEEEIEKLRREAAYANRRAEELEQKVEDYEQRELTADELLRALQQTVREDYDRIEEQRKEK